MLQRKVFDAAASLCLQLSPFVADLLPLTADFTQISSLAAAVHPHAGCRATAQTPVLHSRASRSSYVTYHQWDAPPPPAAAQNAKRAI